MARFPYIVGVIVLVFALYATYENVNLYIYILAAFLIIANITAIKKIRQKNDLFNVITNMGNALLCILIAFEFIEQGKTYYQYFYFVAVFIFLIATYVIYRRNLRPFKKFSSK